MNDDPRNRGFDCTRAIGLVHARLDGESIEVGEAEWLSRHLDRCADCRQAEVELREVQDALRGLEVDPFPPDALETVWGRTTRARSQQGRMDWRALAAAAVLAVAFFGIWQSGRQVPPRVETASVERAPSEEELVRAASEARFVLSLTAAALRRSERAAFGEVMGRRVAPALQRVPLLIPDRPGDSSPSRSKGKDDV